MYLYRWCLTITQVCWSWWQVSVILCSACRGRQIVWGAWRVSWAKTALSQVTHAHAHTHRWITGRCSTFQNNFHHFPSWLITFEICFCLHISCSIVSHFCYKVLVWTFMMLNFSFMLQITFNVFTFKVNQNLYLNRYIKKCLQTENLSKSPKSPARSTSSFLLWQHF